MSADSSSIITLNCPKDQIMYCSKSLTPKRYSYQPISGVWFLCACKWHKKPIGICISSSNSLNCCYHLSMCFLNLIRMRSHKTCKFLPTQTKEVLSNFLMPHSHLQSLVLLPLSNFIISDTVSFQQWYVPEVEYNDECVSGVACKAFIKIYFHQNTRTQE